MEEDLKEALKTLRNGGVIVYPTDTIWGLGCDATNAEAVNKIYAIKNRADSKAMLSLVGSYGMLERFVDDIPEIALELIDAAVSPLTIIYDHPVGLASNLLSDDGSAGIRITYERFSSELCRRFGKPIVSTSANISGEKSPSTYDKISSRVLDKADYVVKSFRNKPAAKPSNIIKLSEGGQIKIIR